MTTRLSEVSKGSREDADMDLHKGKTKTMHVRIQEKPAPPTVEEIKKTEDTYKHACKFCDRKFKTSRGMRIHMASCDYQYDLTPEAFSIEGINAVFGTPANRWYRTAWTGHPGKDSWEPERSLVEQGCQDCIKEFWNNNGMNPATDFIADPDDVWRCWCCGRGYKTAGALKGHITRTHSERKWRGSTADKDTRIQMQKAAQEELEHVQCEGKDIDNVWLFRYLGSVFRADGDQTADIKARIASAAITAGKMRHIWSSKTIPLKLKLRIYKTGVCSRLVYGAEGWRLDSRARAMLNGANSRLISHVTDKSVKEEASRKTRTFDIVSWIRARRLQWVGHILRMDQKRMVHKAVEHIHANRKEGDLLMDAPTGYSWKELKELAANRDNWRHRVRRLRQPSRVEVTMNALLPGARAKAPRPTTSPLKQKSTSTTSKYVIRDRHEMFFRPKAKCATRRPSHKTNTRSKAKPLPLTDKQRAAWAREHYEQHHGSTAQNDVINNNINWSPKILGHHRRRDSAISDTDYNETLLAPCNYEEMFAYFEHHSADQQNLKSSF